MKPPAWPDDSAFEAGAPAAQGASPPSLPSLPSLRSGLSSLFVDRWRIGGVLLAGVLLTLLVAALAPKRYTSEAELLLRLGREYIYKPELGEALGATPVAYDLEQTLQSEARILTSLDVLDAVLDKMGPARVFPNLQASAAPGWWRGTVLPALGLAPRAAPSPAAGRAAALLQFSKALQAQLPRGSNLMEVNFSHADPQLAAAVLREVLDAYLKRRMVIFASAARGTAKANFEARQVELLAAEARLAEMKRSSGIVSFGTEQSLLLTQRNGLEQQRLEAQLALARAAGRAGSLSGSLNRVGADVQLSTETQVSAAVEKARSLLLDLKLKERELSAQFTDDNPQVQDVRADIGRTTAYLNELLAAPPRSVRTGRSPARDAVEADLLRTLADEQQARMGSKTLVSAQGAMERRLGELAAMEAGLNTLERERKLAEANFEAAAKALRDETAQIELDRERRSNVSIVQAPRVPLAAQSYTGLIVGVGLFISLCAALVTAFLSALWRDTFLTPEQAERGLGVPVLTSVPQSTA